MTRKPRIHVIILIYRTWAILLLKQSCHDKKLHIEKQETEDRSHSCDILGTAYIQLLCQPNHFLVSNRGGLGTSWFIMG